jgi:hypothetical protein
MTDTYTEKVKEMMSPWDISPREEKTIEADILNLVTSLKAEVDRSWREKIEGLRDKNKCTCLEKGQRVCSCGLDQAGYEYALDDLIK